MTETSSHLPDEAGEMDEEIDGEMTLSTDEDDDDEDDEEDDEEQEEDERRAKAVVSEDDEEESESSRRGDEDSTLGVSWPLKLARASMLAALNS